VGFDPLLVIYYSKKHRDKLKISLSLLTILAEFSFESKIVANAYKSNHRRI
jgi:hypothetical protein